MWNEYNCTVVWTFFGIALLWDWNENWPFPVLWPWLSFPNFVTYWVQCFSSIILGFEIAQLEFLSSLLALFIVMLPKAHLISHSSMWLLEKPQLLTILAFVSKVISLLFNMLCRFVIAFLQRSKNLLISWLQSPSAVNLVFKIIKSVTASTFSPSICYEVMWLDAMILVMHIY